MVKMKIPGKEAGPRMWRLSWQSRRTSLSGRWKTSCSLWALWSTWPTSSSPYPSILPSPTLFHRAGGKRGYVQVLHNKTGKGHGKGPALDENTWNCADWFWNLKIVVWNLNARCWSRTLCWTSRSTTSQTWRTVPTIRWAFYCLPLLRGLIDDMFFLRQRQICLTMIFLLLRPRGSKLSLVSKTFQDVAAL